jgi:hypothetical protein
MTQDKVEYEFHITQRYRRGVGFMRDTVGVGNVWQFPYLAQKNGGGLYPHSYYSMLLTAM